MKLNPDIEEKIRQFDANAFEEQLRESYKKRNEFVECFSREHLQKMSVEEYAIGLGVYNKPNFCYDLEHTLEPLGSIKGTYSNYYVVWYKKEKKGDHGYYTFDGDYENYEEAYRDTISKIISLLEAGENQRIEDIIKISLYPAFKGKILSTYYPDKYLNIFSAGDLDHFIKLLNITSVGTAPENKREALVKCKNSHEIMKQWSHEAFSNFLYTHFPPERKNKKARNDDPRMEKYREFIKKCTGNEKSIDKYSYGSFPTINSHLKNLDLGVEDILNIESAHELEQIIDHLKATLDSAQKNKKGHNMYSSALNHYLYYLRAKELFSNLDDTVITKTQFSAPEKYTNYLRALRTKPFMLLAGISGTGKSRLVRELAFKSCPNIDDLQADKTTPGNYLMIEVKPNWHDSTEILGYYSNISKKYQFTKFIHFLVKAKKYPKVPFFVCLDEMNLAPVEQYFAEFLSVIETRKKNDNAIVTGTLVEAQRMRELEGWTEGDLTLPDNVFIIGTVNMDDTTHQFSRKVIDRAMTIEMNGDKLANMFGRSGDLCYLDEGVWPLENFKAVHVCADEVLKELKQDQANTLKQGLVNKLDAINSCLKNTPFQVSYRVLNEMCVYAGVLLSEGLTIDMAIAQAVDQITLMKILPRIEGDEDMFVVDKQNKNRLEMMMELFDENSESYKKLEEMNNRLDSGFTRFWP